MVSKADGQRTVTMAYDARNRLATKSYSDGTTPAVSYCYDGVANNNTVPARDCTGAPQGSGVNLYGRLTMVKSSVSTTKYEGYDTLGRVTAHRQVTNGQEYGFGYSYNLANGLVTETYPSGRTVTASYLANGRVGGVTGYAGSSPAAAISYEPFGGMAQVALANGLTESRTFDSGLRLKTLNVAKSGGCQAVLALGNTYAANGNLTEQQIGRDCGAFDVTQGYGAGAYDGVNRLVGWKEWKTAEPGLSNWYRTYGYDGYGNGWVQDAVGVPASSFTPRGAAWFDDRNRQTPPGLAWGYDNVGNMSTIGAVTMGYDGENRLKTYSGTVSYAYDGEGRRVTKTVGAQTTVMVYDALGRLAAEYGGTTSVSGRQYVTVDHLGSTRLVSNAAGGTMSCSDYLPYGEEVELTVGGRPACYGGTEGVQLKFTGKERDGETGLDYFGARYFSGAQGRFTSPDEFTGGPYEVGGTRPSKPGPLPYADITNPQSLNKYVYAFNNPLRYVDPDGHEALDGQEVLEALRDSFVGYGKEAANTVIGLANTVNRPIDAALSTFTDFRFGQMKEFESSNKTQGNAMLSMAIIGMVGTGGESGGVKLVSSIGKDKGLTRLAQEAGTSVQKGIDTLTSQLAKGNLNPGIGTKNLFGNISYARARDGARVFFRQVGNQIEVLAKASKKNEAQVIKKLEELYK